MFPCKYHLSNWISFIILYVYLEVIDVYIRVLDGRYIGFYEL